MPRDDNAAVLAAAVIARLAVPGPTRLTPVMDRFLERDAPTALAEPAAADRCARLLGDDPAPAEAALAAACDPMYARALRALLRDTISPDVVHAGIKYNVIPGDATIEVDCRVLPGTTEADDAGERRRAARAGARRRLRDRARSIFGRAGRGAGRRPAVRRCSSRRVRDHDPDGIPLPVMAPFATDAKHTARSASRPTASRRCGSSPDERFLERFHGVDERVGVDALRWGLPVLYDVVRRFCG